MNFYLNSSLIPLTDETCFTSYLGKKASDMNQCYSYLKSLLLVLLILALHYATPDEKEFWSHAALIFTVLYAVFVTANYIVQLATVIPMKQAGKLKDVAVLEQTPHSMFWNFDAMGYIFMGLAMCIALPLFETRGFQKWVRWAFISNVLVTPLISVVYFYPAFSVALLFLGFPWGITAPLAMLMLALWFKKKMALLS